jgi:superfamily I DNA/RNA helicase
MQNNYTAEQELFINDKSDNSIILSAVAGSGKTFACVGRVNRMIKDGVPPNRIIFFSYTNDAVDELKSRIKHDVKITTIHSFTGNLLHKMGKGRPIATFYDFVNWYKETYKPISTDIYTKKIKYNKALNELYEEGTSISSAISAYKLQKADNIKGIFKPSYYDEYSTFLKNEKARDFSDMLIETAKLAEDPANKIYFENKYDHVFIDEYQDTSTLQMKILLTMKAKQYYLTGDEVQSIFSFSGANCKEIERLLKESRPVVNMTLTKNFRSAKTIVDNSNRYHKLKAEPVSEKDGLVKHELINISDLIEMVKDDKPLAVLVRTNSVIKNLEFQFLKQKLNIRYFNFITPDDIEHLKTGVINPWTKKKIDKIRPFFESYEEIIELVERNKDNTKFITTIHKSKGREFPRCVIVNSMDPEQLMQADFVEDITKYTYINDLDSIDEEARNIHYVAVTRPKEELYFLLYDD